MFYREMTVNLCSKINNNKNYIRDDGKNHLLLNIFSQEGYTNPKSPVS